MELPDLTVFRCCRRNALAFRFPFRGRFKSDAVYTPSPRLYEVAWIHLWPSLCTLCTEKCNIPDPEQPCVDDVKTTLLLPISIIFYSFIDFKKIDYPIHIYIGFLNAKQWLIVLSICRLQYAMEWTEETNHWTVVEDDDTASTSTWTLDKLGSDIDQCALYKMRVLMHI